MGLNKRDETTSRIVSKLVLKCFSRYWVGRTTKSGKISRNLHFNLLNQNAEYTDNTLLNLNHETQIRVNQTIENSINVESGADCCTDKSPRINLKKLTN